MIRESADAVIAGGGFAGCLMALVLQRLGRSVVVLERGSHPRFAIGESSTPLCNLALENISRNYDLPRLLPLTKYGRWQRTYPKLTCGLKRGFTFAKHQENLAFVSRPDHANEMLIAASLNDEDGDTHWFRADFDHFIAEEARAAGVLIFERTEIASIRRGDQWTVHAQREGEPVEVHTTFFLDAAGPSGLLGRALGIDSQPRGVGTTSWSVFSHFEGVRLWADVLTEAGGSLTDHPYACDDAALHHVLADGWIWVLRFNNGITSAGAMLDYSRRGPDARLSPEQEWHAVLDRYPSVARQFASARPVRPFTRTGRLQRRTRRAAGDGWAMLAHAAYFLDPLFSGGNAHTLRTIERLGQIFGAHWGQPSLQQELDTYNRKLLREVDLLDRLIAGCYRCFDRFELLSSFIMNYFAAAIYCEEERRGGGPEHDFLLADSSAFRAGVRRHCAMLRRASAAELQQEIARDLASINSTGLCDPAKHNMYPYS